MGLGSTGGQAEGEAGQASGHGGLGWGVYVKDAEIHQDQASGRQAASESVQNSNGDLATEPLDTENSIRIPGKLAEVRLTSGHRKGGPR